MPTKTKSKFELSYNFKPNVILEVSPYDVTEKGIISQEFFRIASQGKDASCTLLLAITDKGVKADNGESKHVVQIVPYKMSDTKDLLDSLTTVNLKIIHREAAKLIKQRKKY